MLTAMTLSLGFTVLSSVVMAALMLYDVANGFRMPMKYVVWSAAVASVSWLLTFLMFVVLAIIDINQ
jgi:hypothetical protein